MASTHDVPPTTPAAAEAGPATSNRRVITAAAVGSLIENYDFAVYGYVTPIIAGLFFAQGDPNAALLATLATFATAYLARPIGGLVFGHVGDRFGRRGALAVVLIGMALATFLIGVLPTYAAIGVGATALLVLARLIQGLAAGGEIPGAATYVAESSPARRRGLNTSLMQLAVVAGTLLGSVEVAVLTSALGPETMAAWGWRIPFLVALPLGVVGLYVRLRLEDSPEFRAMAENRSIARLPVGALLRTQKRALARGFAVAVVYVAGYYVVYLYMPTYLTHSVGVQASVASLSTTISLVAALVIIPLGGVLADRFARTSIVVAGAVVMGLLAVPMFALVSTGSTAAVIVGQLVLSMPVAVLIGTSLVVLTDVFSTDVRVTGSGLALNLAAVGFGGTAPLICAALVEATGSLLAPAYYLIGAAVLALTLLALLRERASGHEQL